MKKSLLETNPFLKDPAQRKKLLRRSLVTSFAIEGIILKEDSPALIAPPSKQADQRPSKP